jgi:hypothetical protein
MLFSLLTLGSQENCRVVFSEAELLTICAAIAQLLNDALIDISAQPCDGVEKGSHPSVFDDGMRAEMIDTFGSCILQIKAIRRSSLQRTDAASVPRCHAAADAMLWSDMLSSLQRLVMTLYNETCIDSRMMEVQEGSGRRRRSIQWFYRHGLGNFFEAVLT